MRARISNEEFFTRLGQTLVRLLETPTAEGFVLRVDLRLRPFGDSGPLAASFAFFEDYLPRHGATWERYAYVKARPITAAERYAELEAAAVRPFVYRRYLDYGVFESLREMRALIEREIVQARAGRQRQARTRRHPRDRIHRAGAAADARRPRPAPADAVAARRARAPR